MKTKVPYLVWRNGRPRWEPGPALRERGFRGQDLKDDFGRWLSLGTAVERAEAINAAIAAERATPARPGPKAPTYSLDDLWLEYSQSPLCKKLRDTTRYDYQRKARVFLDRFGDAPPAALTSGIIFSFWEEMYELRGHAMANGVIAVLRLLMSYGERKGRIMHNPAARMKLPTVGGRLVLWLPSETEAIVETADAMGEHGIADAFVCALHMGLRKADILGLPRKIFDKDRIRLSTAKTGAMIDIKPTPALRQRLAERDARWRKAGAIPANFITDDRTGQPFVSDAFTRRFAAIRQEVASTMPGVADKMFMDTRDTAVTRLALANGYDTSRIAAVTGHSLKSIEEVMKHYLVLNAEFADDAIDAVVAYMQREGIAF